MHIVTLLDSGSLSMPQTHGEGRPVLFRLVPLLVNPLPLPVFFTVYTLGGVRQTLWLRGEEAAQESGREQESCLHKGKPAMG